MKTYGQIAHDMGAKIGGWQRKWEDMGDRQKIEWEAIAEAVILEFVEREEKINERVAQK